MEGLYYIWINGFNYELSGFTEFHLEKDDSVKESRLQLPFPCFVV